MNGVLWGLLAWIGDGIGDLMVNYNNGLIELVVVVV